MKKLLVITVLLTLLSCGSEQKFEGDVVMTTMVNRIKQSCEDKQSCINEIDALAIDCQKSHAVNLPEPDLSNHKYLRATYEFNACMMEKIDVDLKMKMAQALSLMERNVKISGSAGNVKISYAHENDPGYLQIHEFNGQFKIENELMDIKQIKGHITSNQLTDSFHSVALIVSGDLEVGLLIEAQDQIKAAGFKNVSIARKEHLEELSRTY
jgi:biopolymer transport protein ExbD